MPISKGNLGYNSFPKSDYGMLMRPSFPGTCTRYVSPESESGNREEPIKYGVPRTPDAIILATAHYHDCQVVTSDADLKGKPGVQFIPKK